MSDVVPGVIHGKIIELANDLGLADGQRVEVRVRPIPTPEEQHAAILSTAGALAHLPPEDREALDALVRERQGSGRHRGVVE